MSYDIGRTADLGGPNPVAIGDSFNFTSNCAPMWRAAGADLAEFDGRTCAETIPILTAAWDDMVLNPEKYQAMNPPNGWGSAGACRIFIGELLGAAQATPNARWWVSR